MLFKILIINIFIERRDMSDMHKKIKLKHKNGRSTRFGNIGK